MLSVLPWEMEEIRASQSKMLEREEKLDKKRKPSATITSSGGVPKKAKSDEGDDKKIKKDTKPNTKEGDVKDENKEQVKPSVVLDKNKGLNVHVPVTSGNMIDFQNLQGLINMNQPTELREKTFRHSRKALRNFYRKLNLLFRFK